LELEEWRLHLWNPPASGFWPGWSECWGRILTPTIHRLYRLLHGARCCYSPAVVYKDATEHLHICSRLLLVSLTPTQRLRLIPLYRNCGWFRYWTLSNLPLFLLAAPMVAVMVVSGVWGLSCSGNEKAASSKGVDVRVQIVRNLAVSQLLLTLITCTTAHVQIITRLSSAYPVWLWYAVNLSGKGDAMFGILTKFMVMYAAIQGGLFASFLPPA
jgi:hypothetical protein